MPQDQARHESPDSLPSRKCSFGWQSWQTFCRDVIVFMQYGSVLRFFLKFRLRNSCHVVQLLYSLSRSTVAICTGCISIKIIPKIGLWVVGPIVAIPSLPYKSPEFASWLLAGNRHPFKPRVRMNRRESVSIQTKGGNESSKFLFPISNHNGKRVSRHLLEYINDNSCCWTSCCFLCQ